MTFGILSCLYFIRYLENKTLLQLRRGISQPGIRAFSSLIIEDTGAS
jgi:hypothetical protein